MNIDLTPEPATPRARLYVLPTADEDGQNPPSADYIASHAVEVRGVDGISLAGADEELPIVRQAQLGMLSKKDLAALRRLAGDLTLAEWMAEPPERRKPWRLKEPNAILRAMLLTGARAQQRDMARLAPWLLVPAVRP
jgi:hypothetical protein